MIMIAYVPIKIGEGIANKILAQAKAISKIKGKCILFCLDFNMNLQVFYIVKNELNDSKIVILYGKNKIKRISNFLNAISTEMKDIAYNTIYIRHMIPNTKLIRFLKKYEYTNIYYEIPTYPYYFEQLAVSNDYARTLLRLMYETFFWPFIYRKINKLVVINCRKKIIKFKKMICIGNGYNSIGKNFFIKNKNSQSLNFVGVAQITKYHGYDKLIYMIAKYNGNIKIHFNIIGNGVEIDNLKELSKKLKIQDRISFLGVKTGDELEKYYIDSDIGVGTLALELRRADIDTSIKVIDYYVHGLPVISSGECPSLNCEFKNHININKVEKIEDIYKWYSTITIKDKEELSNNCRKLLSWEHILGEVIE